MKPEKSNGPGAERDEGAALFAKAARLAIVIRMCLVQPFDLFGGQVFHSGILAHPSQASLVFLSFKLG